MKHFLLLTSLFLLSVISKGQIVINEVDSDTPSTDTKEFIELLTDSPNMSLDGYIVVLFNGSGDVSYATIDLTGYSSDANGIFVLGNTLVTPTPSIIFNDNFLQNGADAVAIFQAQASSFPNGTALTTTGLIDALVYDTSDADDTGLLQGLNQTVQYNENENGDKDNQSLQRKSGGTFEVKEPTPGALNGGGGVEKPTITISTPATEYEEGESFQILFTSSEAVTSDLNITFTLENGSFTSADFTGSLSVSITTGTTSASSSITLTDDTEDEGNEFPVVNIINLDEAYQAFNNGYTVKVVDNDFARSIYGTPLHPTYGQVSSTAPETYYDVIDGLSGQALKKAITDLIADPSVVRAQTYGDVWDILKEADQNPENNSEVWLIYSEIGRAKTDQQGSGTSVGKWNREHIYAQSRGGFTDGTSTSADGVDIYMTTGYSDLDHAHGDAHGIRPADSGENSSRGNEDYGDADGLYSGPSGNAGSWKGDVARSLMFMTLRYDGLTLVTENPDNTTVGSMGDLTNLLQWHTADKPDDYEMNRNNVLYTWQYNRNPFIDLPELVDYVFGTKQGEVFNLSTGINDIEGAVTCKIYPNPVVNQMHLSGAENGSIITIIDLTGRLVFEEVYSGAPINVSSLQSGVYVYRIVDRNGRTCMGKFIKQDGK